LDIVDISHRKLDLGNLRDLNDFELYRLYKTLKSNDAIFEVLKYFVNALSELGPGNDRERDFLLTLTTMNTNINQLWIELCAALQNRGISFNPNRQPMGRRRRPLKRHLTRITLSYCPKIIVA
jgi:hypothetical protein